MGHGGRAHVLKFPFQLIITATHTHTPPVNRQSYLAALERPCPACCADSLHCHSGFRSERLIYLHAYQWGGGVGGLYLCVDCCGRFEDHLTPFCEWGGNDKQEEGGQGFKGCRSLFV